MMRIINNIRPYLAGIAITVLITGCRNSSPAGKISVAIELQAEPSSIDMGDISVGTNRSFSIVLKNTSQEKIKISGVRGSCGCMGMRAESDMCAAGDNVKIAGFIHPRKAGSFRHLITILYHSEQSTSSEAYQTIIEITGIAHKEIEFLPTEIVLAPSVDKSSVESTVKIVNRSDRSIQIYQPQGIPEGIEVVFTTKKLQPSEELHVRCRLLKGFETEVQFVMRIMTSLPSESIIDIPVQVRPEERIVITPSEIHLGVMTKRHLLEKGKIRLAVTGIKCESVDFIKAEMPSYIQSPEIHRISENSLDLLFAFVDRLPDNDLGGNIQLTFKAKKIGEKKLTNINVRVPLSGLLDEGNKIDF